jgi:choline/ethanolamine kinase
MFCCRLKCHDGNPDEPERVMVRLFALDFGGCGEAAQAVAFEHFHRAGLGPKLLGVFPGGRIEQFIASRMSTYKDVRVPGGLETVAKLTARMHSLDIPLKKDKNFFLDNQRNWYKQTAKERVNFDLSLFTKETQEHLKPLLKVDFVKELDDTLELMKNVPTRVVATHYDHHSNNILVREDSLPPFSEKDMLLIDMDRMTYLQRGLDLGCFLFEAAFDYANLSDLKFIGNLSDSKWRLFIKVYLDKWLEMNPTKYDPEIDNEENLYLEARILSTVFSLSWMDYVINELNKDAGMVRMINTEILVLRLEMHFKDKALAQELVKKHFAVDCNNN